MERMKRKTNNGQPNSQRLQNEKTKVKCNKEQD